MFALIHDIIEPGQAAPVVRHVFAGDTATQARGYYKAHLKTDRFLRECDERGVFDGRVPCKTRQRMLQLAPAQTKALIEGNLSGATAPATCPVSFWRFAAPVMAGSLAGLGARYVAKHAFTYEHAKTADTAAEFASIAAFWLTSGLTWIVMTRRGA